MKKKILALILVGIMVMGMSITVSAKEFVTNNEEYTIKRTLIGEGDTRLAIGYGEFVLRNPLGYTPRNNICILEVNLIYSY